MDTAANTWQLGSIDRASTTQQVLQELREAIIDGRLKLHAPTWRNAGWKLVQIGRATTL